VPAPATIYALSSAPGKAGVAVVRVSGDLAGVSLARLTEGGHVIPRKARYSVLKHPESGQIIDRALVLFFSGPASFTGEDVVEYHTHGSPAVLNALLAALSSCEGHRMAEPGEFTRRAFENDKLDLTEAEAIADLISAETEAQRLQALSQMGGALSALYEDWRARLIRCMAYIEAVIDFPDEDIPDSAAMSQRPALRTLEAEIAAHLNDNRRGERLREGIRIAILGAPNAGKSSLMNRLVQRDVAIVAPLAGTTRDVLEAHLDIAGFPVVLADTAGLRALSNSSEGHDAIEAEGIRRALTLAEEADIRILLFDGTKPPDEKTLSLRVDSAICVANKSDCDGFSNLPDAIPMSARDGKNIEALLQTIESRLKNLYATRQSSPSPTRARHRAALEECKAFIAAALNQEAPELIAEETRSAASALGRITGRVDVDDLLDIVFRDFCIGK
jgi:tRNA modification GTPase